MLRALLLALVVSLSPPAQDPPAPAELATVPCQACDGEGRRLERCLTCFGAGDVTCWRCMSWTDAPLGDDRDENVTAEELSELMKQVRELQAEIAAKPIMDVLHKGRRAGMAPCPSKGCLSGQSLVTGEDCGYCKGEAVVPCPDCGKTKGHRACPACHGERSVMRACEDCAGTGSIRDPRSVANAAICCWCAGTARRACRDCDEEGNVEAACRKCLGQGEIACKECLGTALVLCNSCNGAGMLKPEKKGKRTKSCTACKKKGLQSCYACKKRGLTACDTCEGSGTRAQRCASCAGDRLTPCMGCFRGRYRQWEVSAELLGSMREAEAALRFLELAAARVEPYYRRQIDLRLDDRLSPEALEARLVAEQARLARAVELARERVDGAR